MGDTPTPAGATAGGATQQDASLAGELETQLIGSREVRFQTHGVQPPAALYVTADDGLYLQVSNVTPNLSVTLTATLLLPDGRVQANAWQVTPPSTGVQTPYLFPLSESFLINVSVTPTAGNRYGSTFVFVAVRRGGMASGINLQTLVSDYLSAYGGPTWPGPAIRHSVEGPGLLLYQFTATLTAGNAFTFTVPTYARVLVRSVLVNLATSATVSTRQVILNYNDPSGNTIYGDTPEPTQAANLSNFYSWGLKSGFAQTTVQLTTLARSLPEIYLLPACSVWIGANNLQANDVMKNCAVSYEQWFTF